MPNDNDIKFLTTCVEVTLEDPMMTTWEKIKFILWLFMVMTPGNGRPLIF